MSITKSNKNGNQGRVFCVCPSTREKRPQQSCNYFEFVDQLDEDVTSMDSSLYVTREEFDDLKRRLETMEKLPKRLKTVEKLLKVGFVIVLVLIFKYYM